MLIRDVLSSVYTYTLLLPLKRSLQSIGPYPSRGMAGSAFRPLSNIPHCCLPQEFGPCLSSNVGDLPLRTPRHRSLGGPLPRRLANVSRANPYPTNLSNKKDVFSVVMRYQTTFPSLIPLIRADCSRVTHPCAGRRHVLLHPLPLDLHVLSLPLAFILSQDQTLHCILNIILSSIPKTYFLVSKKPTLALLILIVLKSVLACTCSSYSFNELPVLSETGCKGKNLF